MYGNAALTHNLMPMFKEVAIKIAQILDKKCR